MKSLELKLKRYLGDGVYAGFDGWQVWLWAHREGQDHEIALERETAVALEKYSGDLREALASEDWTTREEL
jgi:hypothetical protein